MAKKKRPLAEVVKELEAANREYIQTSGDDEYVLRPNPPATDEDIKKLEEHLKLKLTPQFREFLLMHNGYKGLANPGSMLSTKQMMPGSPVYKDVKRWKTDTTQYGGDVIDGVVFADQDQPNDWAYFNPNKLSKDGEWKVVLHLSGDEMTFKDLVAFLESRIEMCKDGDDEVEDEDE